MQDTGTAPLGVVLKTLTRSEGICKTLTMQQLSDISRYLSRDARALFKSGAGALLKAYAFVTGPLILISFLMSLFAGVEGWAPLWWYLQEAAPLYAQVAFWVLLPALLTTIAAALGLCSSAWGKHLPQLYVPRLQRARQYAREVACSWITSWTSPAFSFGKHGCSRPSPAVDPSTPIGDLGISSSLQLIE